MNSWGGLCGRWWVRLGARRRGAGVGGTCLHAAHAAHAIRGHGVLPSLSCVRTQAISQRAAARSRHAEQQQSSVHCKLQVASNTCCRASRKPTNQRSIESAGARGPGGAAPGSTAQVPTAQYWQTGLVSLVHVLGSVVCASVRHQKHLSWSTCFENFSCTRGRARQRRGGDVEWQRALRTTELPRVRVDHRTAAHLAAQDVVLPLVLVDERVLQGVVACGTARPRSRLKRLIG